MLPLHSLIITSWEAHTCNTDTCLALYTYSNAMTAQEILEHKYIFNVG